LFDAAGGGTVGQGQSYPVAGLELFGCAHNPVLPIAHDAVAAAENGLGVKLAELRRKTVAGALPCGDLLLESGVEALLQRTDMDGYGPRRPRLRALGVEAKPGVAELLLGLGKAVSGGIS
jgi:hypothetical protein